MTKQETLRQLQRAADSLRLVASSGFLPKTTSLRLNALKREIDRIAEWTIAHVDEVQGD